jgi:hypothetical protein
MTAPDAALSRGADSADLLWKQYSLHVDLYKFYLDLVIKVNVFYYAITGAIVSYYFQHSGDGISRFGLLLPICFSFAIGGIFLYGSALISVVRQELFLIRDRLNLETAPEFMVLTVFLRVMGGLILCVGIALTAYFILTFVP